MAFSLDPISAGASLIGSIFGGVSQADAQRKANESNERIARENRDWQSAENQINRQWEERMWNAQNTYNTPSAMMARYKEAGLNPYLVQKDGGAIGSASSAGTPGMVGAPATPEMQPVNYLSGFSQLGSAVQLSLQQKSVDANVANQNADAMLKLAEAIPKIGESLGWDNARKFALSHLNMNGIHNSQYERQINQVIDESKARTDWQMMQNKVYEQYGAKTAKLGLDKLKQDIDESAARIMRMAVENNVSASEIEKLASEVARNHADALKSIAETRTIDALRGYLVSQAMSTADSMWYDTDEKRSTYKRRSKLREWQESEPAQQMEAAKEAIESTHNSNPLEIFINHVFKSLHIGH